ncbi:MAG TPA: type I-D CRISPR-associated protein Cas5/Csc1 [Anaerolineae bacterium]|nr:type I-D CRISPR-associated protein Cas5/Csc1 [Anaerolineae bacterium]HQI84566.1 type I-D CRISPR-associated protein Cas5/Csc1 [Anaerolineae bacterium]
MRLYLCRLTFHENLFYATREVGRLYETGRYLHNYALTYALGLAAAPYFQAQQIPRYAEELSELNQRGVYVTPARGVQVRYELATFKYADNAYRVKMSPGSRNTPSFGRAKEVAVGSVFEFAVLSRESLTLPRWIRMGLWRSKALVECRAAVEAKTLSRSEQVAGLPLNPLDVPGDLRVFDLISMPPSSLIEHARIETEWLQADVDGQDMLLPSGMAYTFPAP